MRVCVSVCALGLATLIGTVAAAAPIGVDGTIGAEWAGATVKSVLFNATAPEHNFGAPTNENKYVAYDIYTRGDGDYVYVGLATAGNYAGGLNFANLYFDTNPGSGADIGFEVTNLRAFIPGVAGYFPYTSVADDIHYSLTAGSASSPSVIEFAVPTSFFLSDPLGIGFTPATSEVQLRLSQTFGYSVAGGTSYGDDRLGNIAVPEPSSIALGFMAIGAAGMYAVRRRK